MAFAPHRRVPLPQLPEAHTAQEMQFISDAASKAGNTGRPVLLSFYEMPEWFQRESNQVGKSKQEFFVINGTSRIRNHLEQKHQIDPQSGIKRKGSVRKSIIDQQKDGAASSTFFWKESVEKFKELLIRWIVYCHIAFFQLENQYFRELLLFLNPALLNHLPNAAKTIRSWVMNAFISKKQQLREDLHHSRSRISISFDLWTSPNPYAILGVVAMWIDTTGMRRVTALGMRRIYGEHTGENLGSVVLELLEEYDISGDQIGYFMLDNASANDTAVEFILRISAHG
ncbi:hypothetical protein A1F94_008844 [Pyrenophora tritici-repentis]|nr:hypothetical protein A1F94_008844 [Pyrenophora tritici-repentis]